jgi:hypothetical protein
MDSTGIPAYTAVADTSGRYRFAALPAGRYALRFEHDALDVVGIAPPVTSVTLGDSDAVVDLALPPSPLVRAQVCKTVDQNALLVGRVSRANTGEPMIGATVVARWSELATDRGRLRSIDREQKAVSDGVGRYHFCDLPAGGPLTIGVAVTGFYPIDLEIALPVDGTGRQDFQLAETSSASRRSSLQLEVKGDSGPVPVTGIAGIETLGLNATIDSGHAVISGIPAGTWLLLVRAIGFEAKAIPIEAVGAVTRLSVRLNRLPVVLDSVLVKASSAPTDSGVLHAIHARLLTANGTFIDAENLSVRNSIDASDAVAVATGFSWKGKTKVSARPYASKKAGILKQCESRESADAAPDGGKSIAIYLDGARMPGGLEMVNRMVPPSDILAIEAYPDVVSAPLIWRTSDACAVIAFWTRRKPKR